MSIKEEFTKADIEHHLDCIKRLDDEVKKLQERKKRHYRLIKQLEGKR